MRLVLYIISAVFRGISSNIYSFVSGQSRTMCAVCDSAKSIMQPTHATGFAAGFVVVQYSYSLFCDLDISLHQNSVAIITVVLQRNRAHLHDNTTVFEQDNEMNAQLSQQHGNDQ